LQSLQGQRPRQKQNGEKASRIESIFIYLHIYGHKKNIYYCSEPIRDLVLNNEHNIKIINTGVKTFVRCENRHTVHPFRLAQEGLQTSNAFMGANRRIQVEREDLVMMLNCTDPTQPPSTHELRKETQERCKELGKSSNTSPVLAMI